MKGEEVKKPLLTQQLGAAAFYGLSSILIITVNKTVLTSYGLAAQTGVEWCAPDFPSCDFPQVGNSQVSIMCTHVT